MYMHIRVHARTHTPHTHARTRARARVYVCIYIYSEIYLVKHQNLTEKKSIYIKTFGYIGQIAPLFIRLPARIYPSLFFH